MNFLQHVRRHFHKLTKLEMMTQELINAELELLIGLTAEEHAHASALFNQARIKRLRLSIAEEMRAKRKESAE